MKTPKRTAVLVPLNPEDWPFDPPHHAADMLARWKRKNRIAQLKRSLHRYKHGTNLPFYCHELHAYKRLQELNRPTEKSPVKKWDSYISELSEIIAHLEEARTWALLAKRRKQEEAKRKEQEYNRMVNILPPTAGNVRHAHYPQTVEEKQRFMTEAFGIPDETDGKAQRND